jgi:hypothetical protein
LETAARLQDVGYLINYDQHHKHSYHLILNSRLAGFRPRELELIANIARYHRGARPKAKHANFRQLAAEDQRRVEQLAAILRLAGGLDRSHSQQVKEITLKPVQDGNSEELELLVHADFDPEVDLWGARRRTKLFKKIFGAKLTVEWAERENAATEDAGATHDGLPDEHRKKDQTANSKNRNGRGLSNGSPNGSAATNGAKSRNRKIEKGHRKSRRMGR